MRVTKLFSFMRLSQNYSLKDCTIVTVGDAPTGYYTDNQLHPKWCYFLIDSHKANENSTTSGAITEYAISGRNDARLLKCSPSGYGRNARMKKLNLKSK